MIDHDAAYLVFVGVQIFCLLAWLGPVLVVGRLQGLSLCKAAVLLIPVIGIFFFIVLVTMSAEQKHMEGSA
ncbi:MAG: hypothetical protein AB8B62_17660 [Roseobacter sp.]